MLNGASLGDLPSFHVLPLAHYYSVIVLLKGLAKGIWFLQGRELYLVHWKAQSLARKGREDLLQRPFQWKHNISYFHLKCMHLYILQQDDYDHYHFHLLSESNILLLLLLRSTFHWHAKFLWSCYSDRKSAPHFPCGGEEASSSSSSPWLVKSRAWKITRILLPRNDVAVEFNLQITLFCNSSPSRA